jgi:hypothetical protein
MQLSTAWPWQAEPPWPQASEAPWPWQQAWQQACCGQLHWHTYHSPSDDPTELGCAQRCVCRKDMVCSRWLCRPCCSHCAALTPVGSSNSLKGERAFCQDSQRHRSSLNRELNSARKLWVVNNQNNCSLTFTNRPRYGYCNRDGTLGS